MHGSHGTNSSQAMHLGGYRKVMLGTGYRINHWKNRKREVAQLRALCRSVKNTGGLRCSVALADCLKSRFRQAVARGGHQSTRLKVVTGGR